MKTVTVEQFLSFNPCYGEDHIRRIAGKKTEWSALDILKLDHIPVNDRLWAVLRVELIDENLLHEFACRCAEEALKLIKNPDQRSINAISAKRAWLRGEITVDELNAAYVAADAAARAAYAAAYAAARAADVASYAAYAARAADVAAYAAADVAAYAAARAAYAAAYAAADVAAYAARAACAAARINQVKILIEMLEANK